DTELLGQPIKEGDKIVMWYVASNRDESRYEDPDHFDVTRNPEHQAFGAGGRHFCLGAALARLELKILLEETLARFPQMRIDGDPMQRAVATTVERFGGLDVVMANAGIVSRAATFRAMTGENVDRTLDVNINGVVNTVDAALPEIVRRRGHVVVVASIYAFWN